MNRSNISIKIYIYLFSTIILYICYKYFSSNIIYLIYLLYFLFYYFFFWYSGKILRPNYDLFPDYAVMYWVSYFFYYDYLYEWDALSCLFSEHPYFFIFVYPYFNVVFYREYRISIFKILLKIKKIIKELINLYY
jgi:hypothetical protein